MDNYLEYVTQRHIKLILWSNLTAEGREQDQVVLASAGLPSYPYRRCQALGFDGETVGGRLLRPDAILAVEILLEDTALSVTQCPFNELTTKCILESMLT